MERVWWKRVSQADEMTWYGKRRGMRDQRVVKYMARRVGCSSAAPRGHAHGDPSGDQGPHQPKSYKQRVSDRTSKSRAALQILGVSAHLHERA